MNLPTATLTGVQSKIDATLDVTKAMGEEIDAVGTWHLVLKHSELLALSALLAQTVGPTNRFEPEPTPSDSAYVREWSKRV